MSWFMGLLNVYYTDFYVFCQGVFFECYFEYERKIYLDRVLKIRYNTLMKKYKRKPWTEAERRVLTKNYYNLEIELLQEVLEGRSVGAIRSQVFYLRKRGIKFENTSEE